MTRTEEINILQSFDQDIGYNLYYLTKIFCILFGFLPRIVGNYPRNLRNAKRIHYMSIASGGG
jgi:hypothetical protein